MNKLKNKSLQQIEDFYVSLGYNGSRLRKVLVKDKEYQRLLKEKKKKLTNKFKITSNEKKKYVLATDKDYDILDKCKKLEKLKLSKEDRVLVNLIKAQLEDDWRESLLELLNKILSGYNLK